MVVVEPDHNQALQQLPGTDQYAYVSVAEVQASRPYYADIPAQEFGVIEARIGQALIGVKTARLRKVIMLIPAADADRVIPNFGLK